MDEYKAGDRVPYSGIYRVTHDNHHEQPHEGFCLAGKVFLRCHVCKHARYTYVKMANPVDHHELFRGSKSPMGKSGLRAGGTIIVYLMVCGGVGAVLIRSASLLATVPWIVVAARIFLIPPDLANQDPLISSQADHELLIHFLEEIGIAFVVAAILGTTFEYYMRHREQKQHNKHIEEIESSALSSLLGYLIPPSLSDEIRRVFEEKIMRSNLKVTYSFGNAPLDLPNSTQEYILVTTRVEYDLVNLTRKTAKYPLDHGFEPTLALGRHHNHFVRLEIKRGHDVLLKWPDGVGADHVCESSPTEYIRSLIVENSAEIESGVESGVAIHVLVEHQMVVRRCDQNSWHTWLPANHLEVNAEIVSDDLCDLDFHLERTHPEEFRFLQLSDISCRWALPPDVGVLPYQGFTLYWFPRNSESAAEI